MKFVSEFKESFRIAIYAISANKARGILTTLGIVIGIVAVVTTMTAANGLGNSFKESVGALGTDVLYVSRMPWIHMGRNADFRNRPGIGMKETQDLKNKLQDALAINPTTSTSRAIKFRSETLSDVDIIGTTHAQTMVSSALPEFGRFLTAMDVQYKKNVCVIGSEIKSRLFNNANPINKKIKIGEHNFLVVGVMEVQGSASFFGGPNFDSQIFIPITSFIKNFGGTHRNFDIAVKAPSPEALSSFKYELIGEMRKIRKLQPLEQDNFSINQMDSLLEMYNNVMGVVIMVGLLITGISLFVGGIGVMNIMFVSVTERTKEIGIRKAIGAKKRAIMSQFLFESSVITLLGGSVGVLLAYGITHVINKLLMPASVSLPIVVVSLSLSVLVGILSGIIPAMKASRLNPIDALRYE